MTPKKEAEWFLVDNLENRTSRIDAHYFNPKYFETLEALSNMKSNGKILSCLKKLLANSKTQLTGGATPKGAAYLTEGIPFIRVQNVKECKLEIEKAVFIPRIVHEQMLKRSQLKPKDVILTITGSYGISAVVPDDIGEANMNQHSVKIEVNDEAISPYYLCHFLNSELCRRQMDRAVTGGTRPALDYSAVKSLQILYPQDVDKQNEISQEVNNIYEHAYEKIAQRDLILSQFDLIILEKLGVSIPDEFASKWFLGDISNGNRLDAICKAPYRHRLIEEIKKKPCEKLGKLAAPIKPKPPPFKEIYRLIDMRNVEEQTGRVKLKEVGELKSSKILLEKDQILVSRLNPSKGKVVFVNERLAGCVASTEFIPLSLTSKDVLLSYLIVILRSKIVTDQWKYQVTGSTPSRERITKTELLQTLIPKPDKDIQTEIAQAILQKIEKISSLEKEFESLMATARRTFMDYLGD